MNDLSELPLSERINRTMNILLLVAGAFAFPSIVFLHRDIGRRFAGLQALLSVALIFFWPILDANCDPMPMIYFLVATLGMSFINRMQGLRRKINGDDIFRYYNGYPRLLRFFKCKNEVLFKRLHEPIIVFVIGTCFGPWSPMLAFFLWASAVGLAININAIEFAERERAEAMRDQLHRQQILVERFNQLRGK